MTIYPLAHLSPETLEEVDLWAGHILAEGMDMLDALADDDETTEPTPMVAAVGTT